MLICSFRFERSRVSGTPFDWKIRHFLLVIRLIMIYVKVLRIILERMFSFNMVVSLLHCALFSATSGLNALPSISRDSPLPVNLPPVSPKVWGNFADSIMHYVKRYCLERNTVRARHKVRDFSLFLVLKNYYKAFQKIIHDEKIKCL